MEKIVIKDDAVAWMTSHLHDAAFDLDQARFDRSMRVYEVRTVAEVDSGVDRITRFMPVIVRVSNVVKVAIVNDQGIVRYTFGAFEHLVHNSTLVLKTNERMCIELTLGTLQPEIEIVFATA